MKTILLLLTIPFLGYSQINESINEQFVKYMNRYEYSPYFFQNFEIDNGNLIFTTGNIGNFNYSRVRKIALKDVDSIEVIIDEENHPSSVVRIIFNFPKGSEKAKYIGSDATESEREFSKVFFEDLDYTLRMSFMAVVSYRRYELENKLIELIKFNGGKAVIK